MLMSFILRLVSLAGMATGIAQGAADDVREEVVITSPRVAQVRLAEALGNADAIHAVSAHHHQITFAITRGDRSLQVTATTGKQGQVVGPALHGDSRSGLGGERRRRVAVGRRVERRSVAPRLTEPVGWLAARNAAR
jgi:hypothetical protein